MKTAQQAAQAWLTAMSSGTTSNNYKTGVQGVNESPMAAAATADATQRYLNGVQQSVASGKRQQALLAVSLQTWKDNAANKGAARLATGAAAASSKVQAFFTKWMPIFQQVSDQIKTMPKGGLANAQARSAMAIQMLMNAAGKT